jgi:outer membrane lipoprotein-sorting protein
MRPAILVGLLTLLSRVTPAQIHPDIKEILTKVSAAYTGVSQYELVAELTIKLPGNNPSVPSRVRVAFKVPDQYRMEGTIPGLLSGNSNLDEAVIIHDGTDLWIYLPKPNQYVSIPADKLAADREGSAHTPEATDGLMMEKYRAAADFADGAKFLREEQVERAGVKVSCYVVSVPEKWPGPYTWWVDKTNYHVLREETAEGSAVYTTIKLNDTLPASLFRFEPPPGARKMNQP